MALRLSGGRRLQSPSGQLARPTAARVRQAVLNLVAQQLPGCRWLDLCCGSGAMACEVLQRGASAVVAVERDRRIAATARLNLQTVGLHRTGDPQVEVHAADVLRWLARESPRQHGGGFDLIYVDPPYASGIHAAIATAVDQGRWLLPGGTLIVECASGAIPSLEGGWTCERQRRYGLATLLLLRPERACSAAEHRAATVLVPGSHKQTEQGDRDQTQHDAAEEGFDHGGAETSCRPQLFHDQGPAAARRNLCET